MPVMSDKPKQLGEQDGNRIVVSNERECRYWSKKFGISPERLKQAVRQVGPMVSDVERLLRSRAEVSKSA
jgi:Protein of unknown function (DUF3606)